MSEMEHKAGCMADEAISAYLDGDLEAGEREKVASHLAACQACQQAAQELRALVGDLPSLADVTPERDLWPAIERRHAIEQRPGLLERLRGFWALPVAASVGAAATLLVVWLVGLPSPSEPQGSIGPVSALNAVLEAEQTYGGAIAALEGALREQQQGFNPQVRQVIQQGLAEIDQSIERCRQALRQAPEDLSAHEAMLAAYQHKVDFLTELLGESL